MVENINEITFDDNKPWLAPHYPFSLEGHWQPWYDDKRDYNTNAPTYFDYLSNFNHLIKSITELLNRVARRNIEVQDTNCVDLTKINDWIDEGGDCHSYHDIITLKADVILSTYQKAITFDGNQYTLANLITCRDTGLYASDYLPLLEALAKKLNDEIQNRVDGDTNLQNQINKLKQDITNLTQEFNEYKNSNNDEINKLKQEITEIKRVNSKLTEALQKIVNNLFEAGNSTTNDLGTYQIINHIASGNINLYGGTADGNSLIRTHKAQAENDVTIGAKG